MKNIFNIYVFLRKPLEAKLYDITRILVLICLSTLSDKKTHYLRPLVYVQVFLHSKLNMLQHQIRLKAKVFDVIFYLLVRAEHHCRLFYV